MWGWFVGWAKLFLDHETSSSSSILFFVFHSNQEKIQFIHVVDQGTVVFFFFSPWFRQKRHLNHFFPISLLGMLLSSLLLLSVEVHLKKMKHVCVCLCVGQQNNICMDLPVNYTWIRRRDDFHVYNFGEITISPPTRNRHVFYRYMDKGLIGVAISLL